jgi:WD40 repeat protein
VPFRTLRGRTGLIRSIAYSPDGAMIAAAGGDGSVLAWDAASGDSPARLEGHTASVLCVAFSPDGKTLASAAGDRTIRLWDLGGRSERAVLRGPIVPVTALAFARDGQTLAAASDGDPTIWFWDTAEGRPAATLTLPDAAPGGGFACLAFSPDGRILYTGGERGIAAWDVSPTSKALNRQAARTR